MLQFIFGRPRSGKTYTIAEKIKKYSQQNEKCVLIVPEQFTFESERAVLKTLGEKAALNVDVLSFTRLYDEVGRAVGGIAGKVLNECDKVIFIKQALNQVKTELKLWSAYTNSVNFAKSILDAVCELKINAIFPEDLRMASQTAQSAVLSSKLSDLALIYEYYDALIGEKFIDPVDALTKLDRALGDYNYFKGKQVFIDSFKGFTGQQYRIIDRIISQAENVYVTFSNDVENNNEYNIFTNIKKSVQTISKSAKKYAVDIAEPLVLGETRFNSESLKNLEQLISGKKIESIANDKGINICCAATEADEAEYAVRTIKRLVREENYRYRDFVIIARDENIYREQIAFACKKNDVSCFYDKRVPLSAFPLAAVVSAAIGALNFSSEMILNFHKTGIGTLNIDEISRLENYVLLWNIDGKLWIDEWNMNPNGLTDRELSEDKRDEFLKDINALRQRAISPLTEFKNNFNGNAKKMASAIVKLLKNINCAEKLSALSEVFKSENNTFSAEVLKLSYEEYMKILDSIVSCYGDRDITKEEFCETLNLAVSLADVGVIPQTLDQVTFGSADRIRPSRPAVAFILGANQGVFPKTVQNSGVFNVAERRKLIENGIELSDNSLFSAIDEEFLVYCNLCCASEKLYISYSEQSVSGEKREPSTFVSTILELTGMSPVCEPAKGFTKENLPESYSSAVSEYSRRLRSNKSDALTIKSALIKSEKASGINSIDDFCKHKEKQLTPETAKELFGENIRMSAFTFDTYPRCHFSYFCRYGVNAKKIEPADFNVMQRGTIAHYVLERFISEYKDSLSDFDLSLIDSLTDEYISDYLDSVKGYRSIENAHSEFLVSRISRSLKEVLLHVAKELMQSDFIPVACELKIGENNSLNFPFNGGNIFVNGSIDRVDKYDGYIRIIDYKTGSKTFKLPDILFGLNMQMLIYLYAVTRADNLPDNTAAGILYQPSKRDTNDTGMAMNGLLQADEKLIFAMDKSNMGEYVPKLSFNKDGSISKKSNSFIEAEKFTEIFDYIEKLMSKTGESILSGDISVSPLDGRESPACKYCDYASICGIENREVPRVPDLKLQEVFDNMKED